MDNSVLVDRLCLILGQDKRDQVCSALDVPLPEETDIMKKLLSASTVEECLGICRKAPGGSEVEKKALEKAMEFASTVEECLDICQKAPGGSEMKKKALEKAMEFASTVKECLGICRKAPGGSEVERKALEKAMEFASTVEEYKNIFCFTSIHSPKAYACIKKIAAILEKEEISAAQ